MRNMGRLVVLGVAAVLGLLLSMSHAQGPEYRLQIVNMWENGFTAFTKPGELADGASGPGLEALIASLDRGAMPRGPLLGDRTVRWAGEAVARAYGAERVRAEIKAGGAEESLWDEVKWSGKPGERTVWVINPNGRGWPQQLYHVVLKAGGAARHFIPYTPPNGQKFVVPRFPLEFVWFHEERGGLWDKYLSKTMDLENGMGVVDCANSNPTFPDQVRVVLSQADQPMTYKAVLAWREPPSNLEAPKIPPIVR